VGLNEALRTCRDILEGRLDEIPVEAFYLPAASRSSGCREAWFGLNPPGGTGKAGLAQRPTCGSAVSSLNAAIPPARGAR
jgi:hypothetical protein